MNRILEALYDAPICGNGRPYTQDSDFVKAARIRCDKYDELMKELNDTQKEMFDDYCEASGDIGSIMNYQKFSYGFHLGALLMAEILEDKDNV